MKKKRIYENVFKYLIILKGLKLSHHVLCVWELAIANVHVSRGHSPSRIATLDKLDYSADRSNRKTSRTILAILIISFFL